jgi:hypothetical protein
VGDDNVVQFPTQSVRAWAIVEREIKAALVDVEAPLVAQEHLLQKMKAFHDILHPDFSFSVSIPVVGAPASVVSAICTDLGNKLQIGVGEKLKALTNTLLIERFNREVESARDLGLFD